MSLLAQQRVFILQAPKINYRSYLLSLGPLAYYPMDEITGTVAYDLAGFKNGAYQSFSAAPISVMNAPPVRPGATVSKGFSITADSNNQFYMGQDFRFRNMFRTDKQSSIAYWYKYVRRPSIGILGAYFTNPSGGQCTYRIWDNGRLETPGNTSRVQVGSSIHFDTVNSHFIVFTKGASGYAAYADGALIATNATTTGHSTSDADTNLYDGLAMPNNGDGYNYYGLGCYLSDIALFERALTATEIATLWAYRDRT